MTENDIRNLLEALRCGKLGSGEALARLKHLPFEDLGFAKVDHHRALRQGFAEVVFGTGKTARQVADIVRSMLRSKGSTHNILVTRADAKMAAAVKNIHRAARFHPLSGVITIDRAANRAEAESGSSRPPRLSCCTHPTLLCSRALR